MEQITANLKVQSSRVVHSLSRKTVEPWRQVEGFESVGLTGLEHLREMVEHDCWHFDVEEDVDAGEGKVVENAETVPRRGAREGNGEEIVNACQDRRE